MRMNSGRSPLAILPALLALALAGCLEESVPDVGDSPPDPGNDGSNRAPQISGAPSNAVTAGNDYVFRPQASDPDGDSLTFSVQNLPRWASFNSATGEITGRPLLGDIGVFDQIRLSVSDGTNLASLPLFSITVVQGQLASMSLSWDAPLTNTDGTVLTDLAGYRIYYGLSEGNYPYRVDIDNPSISTFVVENLLPDTYYIVATAVTNNGVESAFSDFAVVTIE